MTRLAVLFASFLGLLSVAMAEEVSFVKDVELPAIEGEELVSVALDSDIYAHSQPNYHDLRLLNGKNKEVAYLVRRGQTKRSRTVKQTWDAENVSLKPLEDGGLEISFLCDTEKHPEPPQGIRLVSPLANFEHRVKVESSTHGHNWVTLIEDGLIFDYTQFMDVRNVTLDLPKIEDQPRFFRITIADVTQEQELQLMELSRNLRGEHETDRTERTTIKRQPFRIDRIELWADKVQQDVTVDQRVTYPVSMKIVEPNDKDKLTYVLLKSKNEPVTSFTIETDTTNFSRTMSVEIPEPGSERKRWRMIGTNTISRIDFRSLKRESLEVMFPETRSSEYRLVIGNRDSPPLEITRVTAKGHEYEVLFLTGPNEKYRLAYGDTRLVSPNYDTAALAASLQAGFAALVATLGPSTEVEIPPEVIAPESFFKWLVNSSAAMTAVIGVLVLVLAVALYGATRHLDDLKDAEQ